MTKRSQQQKSSDVVPWLIAGALLVLSTGLGIVAAGNSTLEWDLELSRSIQRWRGDVAGRLFSIGDVLGGTSLAIIVTIAGLALAIWKRHLRTAIFLISVIVLRLLGTQLKPIFNSPRPTADQAYLHEVFEGTGYPSGHSMTVAMLASMLVVLMWHCSNDVRVRCLSLLLAVMAMCLVGWSRIWSGAHWPTDVFGGWGFGIALCVIAWMFALRVRPKEEAAEPNPTP